MISFIFKNYKWQLTLTWFLVIIENILWILFPFFIGKSIDGLQQKNYTIFVFLGCGATLGCTLMIFRRLYDTRFYQQINAQLSLDGVQMQREKNVDSSTMNARLNFTQEIIDFFENHFPTLIQGLLQFLGSLIMLIIFDIQLGLSVGIVSFLVLLILFLSRNRYNLLNAHINNIHEKQVNILNLSFLSMIKRYFLIIKKRKIQLSNLEALNFAGVMLLANSAFFFNLYLAGAILSLSTGEIFSVMNYTLEFIISISILPMILQNFFRIQEISKRMKPYYS